MGQSSLPRDHLWHLGECGIAPARSLRVKSARTPTPPVGKGGHQSRYVAGTHMLHRPSASIHSHRLKYSPHTALASLPNIVGKIGRQWCFQGACIWRRTPSENQKTSLWVLYSRHPQQHQRVLLLGLLVAPWLTSSSAICRPACHQRHSRRLHWRGHR